MRWLLNDKRHQIAIPNSTTFFRWEADIVSVTNSMYAHEIEIKISKSDFARDAKDKPRKHRDLIDLDLHPRIIRPNYFWYCTPDELEIEVPDYAGWLTVYKRGTRYFVHEKKPAKLLHKAKIPQNKVLVSAHLLSFRVMSELERRSIS